MLFGGLKQNTPDASKDNENLTEEKFRDFVTQVKNEITQWEKNGQWLLSSITPMKDRSTIAGLQDTSPEELRVEAYNALKNKNPSTYEMFLAEKNNHHKQLRDALRNGNPEAVDVLRQIFFKKPMQPTSQNNQMNNTFGGNNQSNTFQQSSSSGSLFGKSTLTTNNLFGNNKNSFGNNSATVFGSKPQPTLFGGSAAFGTPSSSTSLFGGAQPTSGFGSGNGSANVFAQSSVFGKNPTASPFGNASSNSLFGKPQENNSAFASVGSTTTNNVFGGGNENAKTGTGLFNAPQQSSFGFQTQPKQESAFGSNTSSGMLGGGNSSAFGGATNNSGILGGGNNSAFSGVNNNSSNVLSGAGVGSAFGSAGLEMSQTNSSNVFGSGAVQPNNQASVSPFVKPQNTNPPNLFGGSLNNANNSTSSNVFAAFQNTNTNIFGGDKNNTSSNMPANNFLTSQNNNTNNSNVFAGGFTSQSTNATPFSTQMPTNPNVENMSQPSTTNAFNLPNQNLFGKENSQPPNMAKVQSSSTSEYGDSIYTPMHLLTPFEREQYESDVFTFVPFRPPPKELCF